MKVSNWHPVIVVSTVRRDFLNPNKNSSSRSQEPSPAVRVGTAPPLPHLEVPCSRKRPRGVTEQPQGIRTGRWEDTNLGSAYTPGPVDTVHGAQDILWAFKSVLI